MDTKYTLLTLPSGDPTATGTAGDYTLNIPILQLDSDGEYEIALVDVSFPNPGATGNSVYILCDLCDYSTVGSTKTDLLYKTEPMNTSAGSLPLYYLKETSSIIQWRYMSKYNINNVHVRIQESTGTPVPNVGFSTLTVAIRRVS